MQIFINYVKLHWRRLFKKKRLHKSNIVKMVRKFNAIVSTNKTNRKA